MKKCDRGCQFLALLLLACAPHATTFAQAAPDWRFEARFAHRGDDALAPRTLQLAACSRSAHVNVDFHSSAGDSARAAMPVREHGTFRRTRSGVSASDWRAGECATFRVDLARVPAGNNRIRGEIKDIVLVAPQRWLWLPDSLGADATIAFALSPGVGVSVPWRRLADTDGRPTFALGADPLDGPALTAFGLFEERQLRKPGGVLRVAVLAPPGSARARRLQAWIDGVSDVALTANGKLPLRDSQVLVVPIAGSRSATPWGEVQRGGGSALHLYPGGDASADTLRADWTATHEIAHLFHPYLGTSGRWLSEGLASYYQNVLRARAGWMTENAAIASLRAGFTRGRRESAATGMSAPSASRAMHERQAYMRVYWSGAAYWLSVDARLWREHGSSLDAVLARYSECCLKGGDVARVERFIATLDRLGATRIFSSEYARASSTIAFPAEATTDALLDDPQLQSAIFAPR